MTWKRMERSNLEDFAKACVTGHGESVTNPKKGGESDVTV